MRELLIKVVLISVWVQQAAAIHCYDCNSINNTMCLDPNSYDQETLHNFLTFSECGAGVVAQQHYFCRKIVQTVFHANRPDDIVVARGCGWMRSQLDCYNADNEDHMETVCQCFEDGCNGAASVIVKHSLLVASVIGSVLIKFY